MVYYFVDTENIGNQWAQFITTLSEGDHMIMFHTETNCHQSITLDQLSNLTDFGKIKCYSIPCAKGDNALDFQLSSYLGFLLSKACKETDSFVILSRDKGYEPLVSFWNSQGYQVFRKEPTEETEKPAVKKPIRHPKSTPKVPSKPKAISPTARKRQPPGTKTPVDIVRIQYIHYLKDVGVTNGVELDKTTNVLMHTVNLPRRGQALQIQNQMRQIFGQIRGMELYRIIKPALDNIIKNGPYPPKKEGL